MAPNTTFSVVEVKMQIIDGYVYVSSEDVPGLHLCGKNLEKLTASIAPAIKRLFKLNQNVDVEVRPAIPACDLPGSSVPAVAHKGHSDAPRFVMFPAAAAA